MARPPNFRYVSRKAGLLVAVGGLIAIAALVLAGRVQGWFHTFPTLTIILPEEGSFGLRPGSEVQLLGIVIGAVTDVKPPPKDSPDSPMQAVLKITDEDFLRLIHFADCQVLIKKKFAIAGDAFVEFTKGETGPRIDPKHLELYPPFKAKADKEIVQILQDFAERTETHVIPLLEKVGTLVDGSNEMIAYLNKPDGAVRGSLEQVQAILGDAKKSTARLPEIADSAKESMARVPDAIDRASKLMDESQRLLVQVREMSADLKVVTAAVRDEMKDLPGAVLELQELLRQTDRLIVGLQRHWLIRGYVPPDYSGGRIPPGDIDLDRRP